MPGWPWVARCMFLSVSRPCHEVRLLFLTRSPSQRRTTRYPVRVPCRVSVLRLHRCIHRRACFSHSVRWRSLPLGVRYARSKMGSDNWVLLRRIELLRMDFRLGVHYLHSGGRGGTDVCGVPPSIRRRAVAYICLVRSDHLAVLLLLHILQQGDADAAKHWALPAYRWRACHDNRVCCHAQDACYHVVRLERLGKYDRMEWWCRLLDRRLERRVHHWDS